MSAVGKLVVELEAAGVAKVASQVFAEKLEALADEGAWALTPIRLREEAAKLRQEALPHSPAPVELYQDWLEKKRACEALGKQFDAAQQELAEARLALFNGLAAAVGDDSQPHELVDFYF